MLKITICCEIVILMLSTACFGELFWMQRFAKDDNYVGMVPIGSNQFLLAGFTLPDIGSNKAIILKINALGDIQWNKSLQGTDHQDIQSVYRMHDGTVLLAGSIYFKGSPWYKCWLVKVDAGGETVWSKTYGGMNNPCILSIASTPGGNFLLGGMEQTIGNGSTAGNRCLLLEVTPGGELLRIKRFSVESEGAFDAVKAITCTADGNFFLAGMSDWCVKNIKGWLMKVNRNGKKLWIKKYNGSKRDMFDALAATSDGNFLLGGCIENNDCLIKVNARGDPLWTRTYGGAKYTKISAVVPTSDGNFLLAVPGAPVSRLVKISPDGDTIWTKVYEDFFMSIHTIVQTDEGNYILAGNDRCYAIIDNHHAVKNKALTFKIPCNGGDSLDYCYVPLHIPAGMRVSPGGTVSWTPATDSVHVEKVAYVMVDGTGRKDTVRYDLYVNPAVRIFPSVKTDDKYVNSILTVHPIIVSSGYVRFPVVPQAPVVGIYDICGNMVDTMIPAVTSAGIDAVWPAYSLHSKKMSDTRTGIYLFLRRIKDR
jgi:hypothetical protein